MAWSEHQLHRWLARRPRPKCLKTPLGHDAAQLRGGSDAVLCVDACVEGVHFDAATAPSKVGRKAAARALSDLAACGAIPKALLLGLRAPGEVGSRRLQAMIVGLDRLGQEHGAPLVGGDVCCAPGPVGLTVTALGSLARGQKPLSRAGGRAGDLLLLTGPVGGSRAARHLSFEPRLKEGRMLVQAGVRAMMDVSDGLALDCDRLARQSGLALDLDLSRIPVHADARRAAKGDGRSAMEHALNDGEDYELLALLPRGKRALLESGGLLEQFFCIGQARKSSSPGLFLCQENRCDRWSGRGGWLHGA
jgi:thiamine-monophosphate kinase